MLSSNGLTRVINNLCLRKPAETTRQDWLDVINEMSISSLTVVHINNCKRCQQNINRSISDREIEACQQVVVYSLAESLSKVPTRLRVVSPGQVSLCIKRMAEHVLEGIVEQAENGTLFPFRAETSFHS